MTESQEVFVVKRELSMYATLCRFIFSEKNVNPFFPLTLTCEAKTRSHFDGGEEIPLLIENKTTPQEERKGDP